MTRDPFEGAPFMIGEKQALTRWYDAADSKVKNEHGAEYYRVSGQIVRVADVDLAASDYHLEEVLKWLLCVAMKVIGSHDETVQPLYKNNIKEFKTRFPGAFAEYEEKFGNAGIPAASYQGTMDIPRELLGEYTPKPKKPEVAKLSRRDELLRELAELDGEATHAALHTPHVDGEATHESYASDGLSIMDFDKVPPKARKKLLERGVATVGHLAGLPDGILPDLGPGQWLKWRLEAQQATGDPQWTQKLPEDLAA